MRTIAVVIAASFLVGASAPDTIARTPDAQAKLDKALSGRVAGEPRRCLFIRQVLHPIAIDDNTLIFRDGPRIWLNRVQASSDCEQLGPQSSVGFGSHMGYVCSGDPLQFSNGMERGVCVLGEFEPYTKAK
jgi:hypothetical protein